MSDARPYMPSNGTEGMMFEAEFCDRCKNDDEDNQKFCPIHTKALAGEKPKEWIYGPDGAATCTAWTDPVEPEKTTTEIFKDMMDIPFPKED